MPIWPMKRTMWLGAETALPDNCRMSASARTIASMSGAEVVERSATCSRNSSSPSLWPTNRVPAKLSVIL